MEEQAWVSSDRSPRPASRSRVRSLSFLEDMRERHGDVFPLRLVGGHPLLVVSDPDLTRQVFFAPTDVLFAGEGNRQVFGWLLGEHSLLLLDGGRHMSHRRLLLPPLHGQRLERCTESMRALADTHLDAWPRDREVAALPRMRALTLDVVLSALFSDGDEELLRSLREVLLALRTPANPRDGGAPAPRSIGEAEELVGKELARRRRAPGRTAGDDVLSLLIECRYEDGSPLSDAEVRDELMTLIVAGAETSAASLAWALERLARTPGALAEAVAEAADGAGPYIDAVIKETLRVRPPVPMSARLVKRPFELSGHPVLPGTVVAPSALLIHHRSDIYPDPMAFRPERFLESPPAPYTWIPFGGGTRRCIGASFALREMRIVIAALLSRMTPRAADPEPEQMRNRGNTMIPGRNAQVVLEPRRSALAPLVGSKARAK